MKRIVLALLMVGLATLLIPDLRERAEPRIHESRVWLGGHLEGPLTPVLTPYWKLQTQTRIDKAIPALIRDRNQGRPAPLPGEFEDYLERHGFEAKDSWGSPLVLEQEPDSVAVRSPGPDMDYFTEDDIVRKIRYSDIRARSRRR